MSLLAILLEIILNKALMNFGDDEKNGILIILLIPCVLAVIGIFIWWVAKKRNEKDE